MRRGILIVRSLNRPAFTVLLALCCVVGMAQTGHLPSTPRLYLAIGAVGAWMLFAVALNDIVDAEIDRANLVDDPRRMLAARAVERGHLVGVAAISGIVSLSAAALLGRMALVVVACGLVLDSGRSVFLAAVPSEWPRW
ncbi:MAG: UbiA family prenyltransferase [Acidimicrobiia bacterium]